jgi:hypothetical protein
MCIGKTRRFLPGQVTPPVAEKFATATVIATLGMNDWQVCDDAAAAAAELVEKLGDTVTEVTVTIHRDSVEVLVAGGGVFERGDVSARKPFVTQVACSLP